MRKLADCVSVQLIHACESLLTDRFLVVSKQETSELTPLKEVFAMVLGLGHCEQILVEIACVLLGCIKFHFEAALLLRNWLRYIVWGGVKRSTLNRASKVAHLLDVLDLAGALCRLLLGG